MTLARITELHIPWWAVVIGAVVFLMVAMCVIAGGDSDDAPTPPRYRDRTDLMP